MDFKFARHSEVFREESAAAALEKHHGLQAEPVAARKEAAREEGVVEIFSVASATSLPHVAPPQVWAAAQAV